MAIWTEAAAAQSVAVAGQILDHLEIEANPLDLRRGYLLCNNLPDNDPILRDVNPELFYHPMKSEILR